MIVLQGNLYARLAAALLLLLCAATANAVVFVDKDAPSGGNGTSWENAFQRIRDGLNAASTTNNEVWVAEGTYVENVALRTGIRLYGGFAGTETDRSERLQDEHETTIDGAQKGNAVVGASQAVIDGFTITNGKSTSGGGIYCSYLSPNISNCKITQNTGSGIYCYQSSPTIANCEITGNTDKGICCYIGGNATITGCVITENTAVQYAGLYVYASTPTVKRCTITGNRATSGSGLGGGMAFVSCTSPITVENCVIAGNSAAQGGGVYCISSSPSFMNCTISDNSATMSGGNAYLLNSSPAFRNTILAFGVAPSAPAVFRNTSSSPVFAFCDFWQAETEWFQPTGWNPAMADTNTPRSPVMPWSMPSWPAI